MTTSPRFFATPTDFRDWLEQHHERATELLVGFHKTKSGTPSLTWPESVDEALCFGWIDGRRTSLGEASYTIRFTPRKPTSHWSAVNLKRVPELIADERMRPAGLRAYEKRGAGTAGRYSYEQRHTIELPSAALATFRANDEAWRYFEAQPASYRTAAKHWVMSAKKEETRAKRFAILVESSAAVRPIPPMRWVKKKKSDG